MRIIALADAQKRGKTTSIKIAKEYFLNDPDLNQPRELINFYQSINNDFRAVVELLNGYRVAFCSGGDSKDIVSENYQYALAHKCKLLVTASRIASRNDSWDELAKLMTTIKCNDGLLLRSIDFWSNSPLLLDTDNDHRRLSELTAKHLVTVIKYAIERP